MVRYTAIMSEQILNMDVPYCTVQASRGQADPRSLGPQSHHQQDTRSIPPGHHQDVRPPQGHQQQDLRPPPGHQQQDLRPPGHPQQDTRPIPLGHPQQQDIRPPPGHLQDSRGRLDHRTLYQGYGPPPAREFAMAAAGDRHGVQQQQQQRAGGPPANYPQHYNTQMMQVGLLELM
jgi:hypothetical protein